MTAKLPHLIAALTLAVSVFAIAPAALAQTAPPAFQRLDKNSDGKLSGDEAGAAPFFKAADKDGDGFVTLAEAEAHAQRRDAPVRNRTAGMEGDGAAPVFHWPVAPVAIPESDCPVQGIEGKAADGRPVRAWLRKPKGDGPFPTILFIHGGLTEFPEASLRQHLMANPVITRFLAAGYAVVMSTFRTYEKDVQSRGPIEDVRAVACLAAQLLADDAEREAALACLRSGFRVWNPVFAKEGLPNLSSAAEALAFAMLRLPDAERVLDGTESLEALDVLERACATMVRAGKRPADPSAWELLLEVASRRLSAKASDSTDPPPPVSPPARNNLRDLKARIDAIVQQGRQLTSRRLRSELEKALSQARSAAESGDAAAADRMLSRVEAELAKLLKVDPEWGAMLEMDGPLNTNYRRGEGFVIRGTDPHEEGEVRMENGQRVITTDATRKTFPNQHTDIMSFDARSPQLAFIARAAADIFGQRTTLKFHSPTDGFMDRVERDSPKMQFIVNQYFHHDGHDVLASWVLPPGWNPERPSVVLIGVPGMSHSNNSKMFADTAFLKTYFQSLHDAGESANIIMVQFNCGGRSSMGLHPGFESVLDAALRWSEEHLGARRDAVVLMGGSRGGYGSLCWGGRLAALPGYRIRGIFASVFGIASVETSHPFELVPSVATNYNILGDFEEWKHLLYETDGAELRRRYFATGDLAEVERLGPLGAAELLGAASASAPISVYLAFGTADRTALNSSHHRIYNALTKHPGLRVQADFFQGLSHEAGNDERNENAARFVAALARDESTALKPQRRYVGKDRILTDPARIPAHLRLPLRTAPGRSPVCDITGPAGARYEVRLLNGDGKEVARETGTITTEEYAMPALKAPGSPGSYTLEFRLDGRLIGTHPLVVEPKLPQTYEDLKERWLPAAMPVIEEGVRLNPETIP